MKRREYILAFVILLGICLFAACSSDLDKEEADGNPNLDSAPLKSTIEDKNRVSDWLKEKHDIEVLDLNLKNKSKSSEGLYYFFVFTYKDESYEGIAFCLDEKIVDGDFTPISSEPFTMHTYSTSLDKDNEVYITGIVNDRKIKYISIYYNDESVVTVEPADGEYYFDLGKSYVSKIVAYDDDYEEIYSY